MSRYKEFLTERSNFPEERITVDTIRKITSTLISKGYMFNVIHDNNYVLWEFTKKDNKNIYLFGVHSSTDLLLSVELIEKTFTKSDLKANIIGKYYINSFKRLGRLAEQNYFQKQYENNLPLNDAQVQEYKKICHEIEQEINKLVK